MSIDGLIPKSRRCRNQHTMAFQFQTPIATTDIFKAASSPCLLGIGMTSPVFLFPLLKVEVGVLALLPVT